MGTEGFTASGNEGSDENGVSRSIDDGDDSSNVSFKQTLEKVETNFSHTFQDVIETSEASHRKSTTSPQPAASTSKHGSPRKDENTSGMLLYKSSYHLSINSKQSIHSIGNTSETELGRLGDKILGPGYREGN